MTAFKPSPSLSIAALCLVSASVAYALAVPSSNPTDQASQLLATRTYNGLSQMTSEGDAANQFTTYQYNSVGQKILTITRNGKDLHQNYTAHGLIQASWADTSPSSTTPSASATDMITHQYVPNTDQLTQTTYQQNSTTQKTIHTTNLTYDLAGQLSKKAYDPTHAQQYTYNRDGSIATFTNVLNQKTTYTYTDMQQLHQVNFLNNTTTYTYGPYGRMQTADNGDGINTQWTYDDYNGVASMEHFNNTTPINGITYTYDIDGNIANKTMTTDDPSGKPLFTGAYQFGYNPVNELISLSCTGTLCPKSSPLSAKDPTQYQIAQRTYTYTLNKGVQSVQTSYVDGAHKPTTQAYHYYLGGAMAHADNGLDYPDRLACINDSAAQACSSSDENIYDADGNMTRDQQGNTMSYDALDQMMSMTMAPTSGYGKPMTENYGYNADGKLDQQQPAGQTYPIQLYYSTGKTPIITARLQEQPATKTQPAYLSAVSYALGANRISRYYFENVTKPVTLHQDYLFNQHGDVLNTVDVTSGPTDTKATTTSPTNLYTPYGYLSVNDSAVTLNKK